MDAETINFIKEAGIVGAAASIVIALGSFLGSVINGYFKKKSNARYLGIKVIPTLDNFILECATALQDDGTHMLSLIHI